MLAPTAAQEWAGSFGEGVGVHVVEHVGLVDGDIEAVGLVLTHLHVLMGVSVVVLEDTPVGRTAGAWTAARGDLAIVTGCIAMDASGDVLSVDRRAYGGAIIERSAVSGLPVVITLEANRSSVALPPQEVDPSVVDDLDPSTEALTALEGHRSSVSVVSSGAEREEGVALSEANIVIAVGGGVGSADEFAQVRRLGERLGAAVAGSKVAVDRGWVASSRKVGLTGTAVAPDVYLALGISGASQHMAGCARAATIVAVNSDPRAPIFRYARVGIVGDAAEVVAALLAATDERRS